MDSQPPISSNTSPANYAGAVQDLCAMFPPGTYYNTSCGTTVETPSLDQILATMRAFQDRQREIDEDLASALGEYVRRRGGLVAWSELLGVPLADLVGVIDGDIRPIPGRFWDRVQAVFNPRSARV